MNKQTLIEEIGKKSDLSKSKIEETLNLTLDAIKAVVKKHKKLQLVGFGTFAVKNRAARKGINPQTGKTIQIKASKSVGFKVSKEFKKML
ncbi:MAG TPA: HU family DNA-binding protein [archaeon]|jgi:DNA-binding protein HU-beta|nr:HU family DNA-binding protein [archaeon]HPV66378.1 HU family DNA-binding protein [archaeon]HRS42558.1 HU family DNA-binding protein [Candidatus Diapherotrites archaeon]